MQHQSAQPPDEVWNWAETSIRQNLLVGRDERGWTPLHSAVWANCPIRIAKLLIEERGFSPNDPDNRGNTSMHDAAFQNVSDDLLRYLLSVGGNPNQPNKFGETAVFEASYRARPSVMKILLEHNGGAFCRTRGGRTPLMEAISSGNDILVIKYLLLYGASLVDTSQVRIDLFALNQGASENVVHYLRKVMAMIIILTEKGRLTKVRDSRNTLRMLPAELIRQLSRYL